MQSWQRLSLCNRQRITSGHRLDRVRPCAIPCQRLASFAWLWILACGGGANQGGGEMRVEQLPDDMLEVIGTSDMISHIADATTASDGTIWILNSAEPYFIQIASDGSVRRSWGRRGGGPSEFRNPNALVTDSESGNVWVYDRGHHAMLRVDGDEDVLQTIAVPRDAILPGLIASTENAGSGSGGRVWLRDASRGVLFAVGKRGASPFTRLWSADIIRLQPDGSTSVAFAVSDRVGDPATRFGEGATEFLPYPLWAVCNDGSGAVYSPLRNSVIRYTTDDVVSDSIALPPEQALEITMDRIFRMAYSFVREQTPGGQAPDSAMMYAQLQAQWGEMQAQAAHVFPEYADLHCAGSGVLWIQRFDPDQGKMGRGPIWYRLESPGPAAAAFHFPEAFQPLRFEGNVVLGILRDELDIEHVARLRLPTE